MDRSLCPPLFLWYRLATFLAAILPGEKHIVALITSASTWKHSSESEDKINIFFKKVLIILHLVSTVQAVDKRKISFPCREWNHDSFVVQPIA